MRVATSKLIAAIGAIGALAAIAWVLHATKNGPITLEPGLGLLLVTPFAMFFGGSLVDWHTILFATRRNILVKIVYWLFVAMVIVIFIGLFGMALKSRAI